MVFPLRGNRSLALAGLIGGVGVCLAAEAEVGVEDLPKRLGELKLVRTDVLSFDAHHVQGLIVTDQDYLISSVDGKNNHAWLYRVDRGTMKKVAEAEISQGAMIHPGGMDADADGKRFWVPLAEYDRNGPSMVQQRRIDTLALVREFQVADHIGVTAFHQGSVWGGNWDAKLIYRWDETGKVLSRRANSLKTRYQDFDGRGKYLVAGGMGLVGGMIDWFDAETLEPVHRMGVGNTPSGARYTREGISLWKNQLFLMPEDGHAKIYVFDIARSNSGAK
jgi:hypothetical protein